MPRKINVSEVESYIRDGLRRALERDLRKMKMVKEGDLQSCAYFHLRRKLAADPRWRIVNKGWVKKLSRYPDMILFTDFAPRIAIEFKWNPKRDEIQKKDRQTLLRSKKKLKLNKTYFIYTELLPREKRLPTKKSEKYSLLTVPVRLNLPPKRHELWLGNLSRLWKHIEPRK
ncbi:MAG: hypothetical protein ABIJ09_04570 [Pseudomonadota bacterium]